MATQLGVAGTLKRYILSDPAHSLLALIEQQWHEQVIAASQADPELRAVRVWGGGHAFWIDETTHFTEMALQAVSEFLLTYQAAS